MHEQLCTLRAISLILQQRRGSSPHKSTTNLNVRQSFNVTITKMSRKSKVTLAFQVGPQRCTHTHTHTHKDTHTQRHTKCRHTMPVLLYISVSFHFSRLCYISLISYFIVKTEMAVLVDLSFKLPANFFHSQLIC